MLVDPAGQALASEGDAVMRDAPTPKLGDVVHMCDGESCAPMILMQVFDNGNVVGTTLLMEGWMPPQRPLERVDRPDRVRTRPGPWNSWHPKGGCPWKR